jgi:hypothetical protein
VQTRRQSMAVVHAQQREQFVKEARSVGAEMSFSGSEKQGSGANARLRLDSHFPENDGHG